MSSAKWVDVSEGRDSINPKTGRTYSHTLNRNENKKSDKEPDYRGMIHINLSEEVSNIIKHNGGKLSCNLSGWQRDGVNGKFLSLQLQHAIEAPEAEEEGAVLAGSSDDAEIMAF